MLINLKKEREQAQVKKIEELTTFNFLRILSTCVVSNPHSFGLSKPTPVLHSS